MRRLDLRRNVDDGSQRVRARDAADGCEVAFRNVFPMNDDLLISEPRPLGELPVAGLATSGGLNLFNAAATGAQFPTPGFGGGFSNSIQIPKGTIPGRHDIRAPRGDSSSRVFAEA